MKMRKTQILMIKSVSLGLSIIYLRKTVMCEFWNDYVKPKNVENVKLSYMDTGSFVVHVKAIDIYKTLQKMLKQGLTVQILN